MVRDHANDALAPPRREHAGRRGSRLRHGFSLPDGTGEGTVVQSCARAAPAAAGPARYASPAAGGL